MNTQWRFISKILLLSAALSIAIKYGGRYIPIQPTTLTAAIIVFLPSVIIGLILGWQYLNIKA